METKYCIECEEKVETFLLEGEYHMKYDENLDSSSCEGPFATCPPPVLPDGWENQIEEPGSDELFAMNVTARQLLAELVG